MLRAGSASGNGTPREGRSPWWFARPLAREALLITLAILAYFGIRNATVGHADAAFDNAERIVDLQERVGIDWEDELQGLVIDSDLLVDVMNWVYIWGHWPVILSAAVVLFFLRRDRYVLLRNALFVSGGIGFLFFALFPVAPPRLLDLGLVDTVTERSYAYRALQPPGLTNQYAAFPSLHAGWNLLVGIVLVLAFTRLGVRAFAIAMPAAMALAVVMTANHFVIDVFAGVVVILIGLGAAFALQLRRPAVSTLTENGVSGDGRTDHRPAEYTTARGRSPRG
ncbi:MAG TPA: phosphatase PAP2 family protein [Gaiellaceae bacterium]|nr:phosphatase PAP2 family protein [Gaiellaceae bacterium]